MRLSHVIHHVPVRVALLLDELSDQLGSPGSVRNARTASAAASQRRLEREEVDQILSRLAASRYGRNSS